MRSNSFCSSPKLYSPAQKTMASLTSVGRFVAFYKLSKKLSKPIKNSLYVVVELLRTIFA